MARKLKFGSPAWRKKYMKKKRKNVPKRKRAVKVRRTLRRKTGRRPVKRGNPPKLRRLKKSTGWVKAKAVKVLRKGGRTQILIRK